MSYCQMGMKVLHLICIGGSVVARVFDSQTKLRASIPTAYVHSLPVSILEQDALPLTAQKYLAYKLTLD